MSTSDRTRPAVVPRRSHALRIDFPVLVLTARDAADSRSAALELGAVDYMVEPIAFVDLLTRVADLVPRGT
jgi:DNA-binding response OmpR family regulator